MFIICRGSVDVNRISAHFSGFYFGEGAFCGGHAIGKVFFAAVLLSAAAQGFPSRGSCRRMPTDEVASSLFRETMAATGGNGRSGTLPKKQANASAAKSSPLLCGQAAAMIRIPPHPSRLSPCHLPLKGKAFFALVPLSAAPKTANRPAWVYPRAGLSISSQLLSAAEFSAPLPRSGRATGRA